MRLKRKIPEFLPGNLKYNIDMNISYINETRLSLWLSLCHLFLYAEP